MFDKFHDECGVFAIYGHPDAPAKLVGKGITVMFSPLPRNKRAKNPRQPEDRESVEDETDAPDDAEPATADFSNNAFEKIELNVQQDPPQNPPQNPMAES